MAQAPQGDDLVIGLNTNGRLLAVARQLGGKTYAQFNRFRGSFADQLYDVMVQARRIKIDLTGVDLSRINDKLNKAGIPTAGYTNYELWVIKNTPAFSAKAEYYENGVVLQKAPF